MKHRIYRPALFAISFLCLVFFSASTAAAKGKDSQAVYAFGYATCLGDSAVYLSAIQVLDSAQIAPKTGFLVQRADYSRQLEQAMKARFGKSYTCAIFFNATRSKLEKSYLEVKRRAERDKAHKVYTLAPEDFKFTPVKTPTE